ncbi:MAG: hypothetical protein WA446_06175 [Steroidobacteraceae bacterium]
MSLHTTTRVPVDDAYAALVGKAVYVFAYYEWVIIYIIECLHPGFVGRYSRGNPMTSGRVGEELQAVIDDSATSFAKISQQELRSCCSEFERLIAKRNALIHAHPLTDTDDSQILGYQTKISRPIPDMQWPRQELEATVAEFDGVACRALALLDKLR